MSYIYANGQKIVTLANNKEYYTHSDHLGSTGIVTDETGTVVEEIGYLPFGSTLFRNTYNGSTWASAYRFTGQEFDPEYHLYNYNARLYDPIMSRFITPDTIIPDPYNPQSLNRYTYCLNNPLRYTDPSGHFWEEIVGFINWVGDQLSRMMNIFPSIAGGLWDLYNNIGNGFMNTIDWISNNMWGGSGAGVGPTDQISNVAMGGQQNTRSGSGDIPGANKDNQKKIWVGLGADQYKNTKNDYSNTRYPYLQRNTTLIEAPSSKQFKKATEEYEHVLLHTHASSDGFLEFSDGPIPLSSIIDPKKVSAKVIGISSCYPEAVKKNWDSLNISLSKTQYLNLSVIDDPVNNPTESNQTKARKLVTDTVLDILKK
jgi:RHS repeat-associated protein